MSFREPALSIAVQMETMTEPFFQIPQGVITLLIGPKISFRTAGMLSANPRTRASSESRLSVSISQGSGRQFGFSRCGALIAREDGVNEAEGGTLMSQ